MSNPHSHNRSVNPYATPAEAPSPDYDQGRTFTREDARIRLLGPAAGILVTVAVGLAFLTMFLAGIVFDPQVLKGMPQGQGIELVLTLVFVGGILAHLVQLVGAIAMLRVRGKKWAMLAIAASFVPCNFYCCWLAFPFAVWGTVVLANPDVRAAFDRE